MKTADEIKRGLATCAEDDCRDCAYYKGKATCLQGMIADALAYIKRLEAERDAQKAEFDRQGGDLCMLCKHANNCWIECGDCNKDDCPCKVCLETRGKAGYEWDGGDA